MQNVLLIVGHCSSLCCMVQFRRIELKKKKLFSQAQLSGWPEFCCHPYNFGCTFLVLFKMRNVTSQLCPNCHESAESYSALQMYF